MAGIRAEKFDSKTASPSMPGIATNNIAGAHCRAGIRRQRKIRIQIPAVTIGVRTKFTQ